MKQDSLRTIVFGAHPDDCEIFCGGLAAKMVASGHAVKFVSMTNGNAGHHEMARDALKERRAVEAQNAAAVLGIEYEILDFNDGELLPSLEARFEVIRLIREWQADMVFSHRPNDYHPDHRYTGILVQDAAYMVMVPPLCPETPAMRKNPYFFYLWDRFTKPAPFEADVVLSVDDVMSKKWEMMQCHESQFFEWLPFIEGHLDHVPMDAATRREWLVQQWSPWLEAMTRSCDSSLEEQYGYDKAATVRFCEAFEVCEYGQHPSREDLARMFPY